MTTNHIIITLIVLLSSVLTTAAQYTDFPGHPEILSFEEGTAPVRPLKKSSVSTSPLHFKLGENSLLWKWKKGGAGIEIPGEIPYLHKNPNPKETSVSTFVFWVYSETPLDGQLTFSFMKGDSLYAIVMRCAQDGSYTMPSLGEQDASHKPNFAGIIKNVSVLGFDTPCDWTRGEGGLHVKVNGVKTDKPVVFRVELV